MSWFADLIRRIATGKAIVMIRIYFLPRIPRMMAQGGAWKDAATGMLRRLLAYYDEWGAALIDKAMKRKRTPRRRAPAKISDAHETGVAGKFSLKPARWRAAACEACGIGSPANTNETRGSGPLGEQDFRKCGKRL